MENKIKKYLTPVILISLFLVFVPKTTQGVWTTSNCYTAESNCATNCNAYCTALDADKGYCYSGYSNCGLVSERRTCWCWKEAGGDCKTACSGYAAYYCSSSANWRSVFNEPTGICSGSNRWHCYEAGTKSECGGQYCYCFNFMSDSHCALTVTNSTGASNITSNSARLNGEVAGTGGENPTVHIYWGDNDGGTTPLNWDTDVNLGVKGLVFFYQDIAALSPSTTYYYRSYAVNASNSDWADSTATFTTSAPLNQTPTVSSVSDSPDPVTVGNNVTFTVNWSDPNSGDQTKIHLCKTNTISGQICSGGSWCDTASWSATSPSSCSYITTVGDVGTKNYYAFVCDDDNACSSSTAGTFTVAAVGGCSGTAAYQTPGTDTCISQYSTSYACSNASNGSTTDWWFSATGNIPGWTYGDLTAKKCVSGVRVYLYQYDVPETMDIQVSNDAVSWTTVVNDWQVTSGETWVEKTFSESNGRYLRLYIKSAARSWSEVREYQVKTRTFTP